MLPTPVIPLLGDLAVYQPAELELPRIRSITPLIIAEVGCGSGLAISFLTRELSPQATISIATDLNLDACRACSRTASVNNTCVEVIGTTYFGGLRLRDSIDIILCNPPYVPTEEPYCTTGGQFANDPLSAAWIGGFNGRQMIDELIPIVSEYLSHKGFCYILLLKANMPADVIAFAARWGLHGSIVCDRVAGGEHLYIIRLHK